MTTWVYSFVNTLGIIVESATIHVHLLLCGLWNLWSSNFANNDGLLHCRCIADDWDAHVRPAGNEKLHKVDYKTSQAARDAASEAWKGFSFTFNLYILTACYRVDCVSLFSDFVFLEGWVNPGNILCVSVSVSLSPSVSVYSCCLSVCLSVKVKGCRFV